MIAINYSFLNLTYKHPFRIAHGVRSFTPSVFVHLKKEGKEGFGEATLPPYLPETQESVANYLSKVDLSLINEPFQEDRILSWNQDQTNNFAQCALLEAYSQLHYGLKKHSSIEKQCTYTLGIGNEEEMLQKLDEGSDFKHLKVKLNNAIDQSIIHNLRKYTDLPISVDANQSWSDLKEAKKYAFFLKDQGIELLEQPFHKDDLAKQKAFSKISPLPIIADESIQNLEDIKERLSYFDGVNVKILKSGGGHLARKMAEFAKENAKFVLLGCMSESTCGVYHAAQNMDLADLLDLDGPYLINNDPFTGFKVENGWVNLSELKLKPQYHFTNNIGALI
jgi:L-alanine-DL-glutamate epimerase-like enolase superfamily enzyme